MSTAELERRCVNILGNPVAAPSGSDAPGCSTTGSSEACMLGGVALLYHGLGVCALLVAAAGLSRQTSASRGHHAQ